MGLGPDAYMQLTSMIDAARADGSARVVVSCDTSRITFSFGDHGVVAETVATAAVTPEDKIALQILGWRSFDDVFVKEWRPDTPSHAIANDAVRTAVHAYQCDSFELQLALREPATTSSVS